MNTQAALQGAACSNWAASDLVSFQVDSPALAVEPEGRLIRIETAHANENRIAANELLNERYHWRGYGAVSLPVDAASHCLPLTASREGKVIGTLTVNFDSARGLNCDDTFPEEVAALRSSGQGLCEFTKLAVDSGVASTQVLAALFHVAFLAAWHFEHVDTLLLEVNPRHVRYYRRMLGARVLAVARLNRRVSAPAVLLAIATVDVRRWIDKCSSPFMAAAANDAQDDEAASGFATDLDARTLYGRAFNRTEEAAILSRLAQEWPPSAPFAFRLPNSLDSSGSTSLN